MNYITPQLDKFFVAQPGTGKTGRGGFIQLTRVDLAFPFGPVRMGES